ncbi:MAG: ABC transporter permease [Lachnospiraceae bacterium]|nr:ABC transporter permease [Lachnospiraceae bacterium]
MTVFKSFFKVLESYKVSMMIYMGIMIGVVSILAGTSNHNNASYYDVSQNIVIEDEDGSEASKALIEFLGTKNTIKTGDYSKDQITDLLYYTWISNYIRIPEGFGEAFLKDEKEGIKLLECKKNEATAAGYSIESEIDGYLNLLAGYVAGGFSLGEAKGLAAESLNDKSAISMVAEVKVDDEKLFTVFTVLPYGIISILLSAVLPVILRFGSEKIRMRSAVSAMSSSKRQLYTTLSVAVVSTVIVAVLVAVASILSGEAFTSRWWLVTLNFLVLSLTMVLLVVALSNFKLKPEAAVGIANVIGLSFCFLGGAFVPMEVLGEGTKMIGRFLPTFWHSEAVLNIKNGGGFLEISNCLLIQLLFGIMVMGIGLFAGKYFEKKS